MTDLREIERMTIHEYDLRMTAYSLKNLDARKLIYEQAWANAQAKAKKNIGTDKKPKLVPVFQTFEEFFDYKKYEQELLGETEDKTTDSRLASLVRKANG